MNYFYFFLLLIVFTACTVTVPDYVSEETGESSVWQDFDNDTIKDFSVYISYSQDQVAASISLYADPDSIGMLEEINVAIKEFGDQDSEITFTYGEFPGSLKEYRYGVNYGQVRDSVIADCDSMNFDQISFNAQKLYNVSEQSLPETLELWYDIKTTNGNASGTVIFKKTEREYEQVMRLH